MSDNAVIDGLWQVYAMIRLMNPDQEIGNQPALMYERRLLAYIDILGWKNACCRLDSKILHEALNIIFRSAPIYSPIYRQQLAEQPNMQVNPMFLESHLGAFSDCLAYSVPSSFGTRIFSFVANLNFS